MKEKNRWWTSVAVRLETKRKLVEMKERLGLKTIDDVIRHLLLCEYHLNREKMIDIEEIFSYNENI